MGKRSRRRNRAMGRPPINPELRRSSQVRVTLTREEKRMADFAADSLGLTTSDFIRNMLVDYIDKNVVVDSGDDESVQESTMNLEGKMSVVAPVTIVETPNNGGGE